MIWLELAALFETARSITGLAVNWLIQSTLLISSGLTLGYLLRQWGSAVQSAIYRTTLIAVLACPIATLALSLVGISGWSLQMPEAYQHESLTAEVPVNAAPPIELPVEQPGASSVDFRPTFDSLHSMDESGANSELDSAKIAPIGELAIDRPPVHPNVENAVPPADVQTVAPENVPGFDVHGFGFVAAAAGALWFAAGGFLLCRLGLAWWRLNRLRRDAWAAEPPTVAVCRELAALLNVSPPEVLHSPFLPSPCLSGLRRPAVLLPEAELSLPVRDVLVHELAHLRRHDCWWNLLRRVATAVLFFQPLLWKLSRRLDSTAEEVCDDYVVQLGGDRREYAHRLVDIAELSLAPAAAAGVGIVSLRSMLAARVARIMDTSRSLSTRAGGVLLGIVLFAGLAATLLVGLVGIKPGEAAAETAPQSADTDEIAKVGEPDSTAMDELADPGADDVDTMDEESAITIRGQVVGENGKPLSKANVRLPDDSSTGGESVSTTEDGRFEIEFDKSKFRKPDWHQEPWRLARLVATAEGFGPAWVEGEELTRKDSHTLQLKRDVTPVRGQILTLEGAPVPYAKLEIWNIYEPHSGNLDSLFKILRDSPSMFQPQMNRQMSYFPGILLDLKVERGTLSRGTLSNAEGGNPIITTDENGQFEFRGIGPERMARLWLQGPNIQSTQINVGTRREIDLKWQRDDSNEESRRMMDSGAAPPHVHAANFKHFAGPSAPIRGIVTDKDTGEPIAGIHVGGWLRKTNNHANAVSDENGRYELTGLGVEGTFQQLYAGPKEEDRERLPYVGGEKEKISYTVTSPLSEADTAFKLTRGILVRGRVTDAATQKPVKARVEYFGYTTNPHVQALSDELWPYAHAMTNENGDFTIAVLPGPGTLAVWTRLSSSVPDLYRPVDPKDFGAPTDDRGMVSTANTGLVSPADYKAARFIDFKPGDTPPFIELAVKPVTDIARVRTVDPQGQPLQGVSVIGHLPWSGDHAPIPNAGLEKERSDRIYIEIAELGAESRKPVVFRHRERKLAAILFSSQSKHRPRMDELKQTDDGVHLLELMPSASITGRLVDEEGEPVRSGEIELHFIGSSDSKLGGIELADVPTDQNGSFSLPDLPAGGPYVLSGGDSSLGGGILKREIELVAGQTLDLGALDVTKAETPEPKKAATDKKADTLAKSTGNGGIQGLVVGPDGKPIENAQLYWLSWRLRDRQRPKPKLLATTDADGAFRFNLPAATPVHDQAVDLMETQLIAVTGKGTGLALVRPHELGRGPAPKSVVGQIVKSIAGAVSPPPAISLPADDVPLRGRIVNIDGQPVGGAKVLVREISDRQSDTRAAFHGEPVNGENAVWRRRLMDMLMQYAPPQLEEVIRPVATDADGRFVLHGLGRDRLVELLVEGERIESTLVLARTENGEAIRVEPDRNYLLLPATIHGAEFTQVVGPSKPVTGRVLDLDSGEPIAGAVVRTYKIHTHPLHTTRERGYLATTSDAQGRFRITGLPIGDDNKLVALAPDDQPYVPVGHTVDTSAEGAEIEREFRMKRGVWAEGRVHDAQTNEPLTGKFDYFIFRDPKLESEIPGLREAFVDEHYFTDADGKFRIPVLRARGVIGFWYSGPKDAMAYPRGAGAEDIAGSEEQGTMKTYPTLPSYLPADNYWKVAEVNPTASDDVVKVDMALSAGQTAIVRVTDSAGAPLSNVDVYGKNWGWEQNKGPEVQIIGLQPGQQRKVLAYQPDKRLAGAAVIADNSAEPVSIKLASAGSVRGRLVDDDGQPIADARIIPDYEQFNTDPNVAVWPYQPGLVMNPTNLPVGEDGRFEIVGLIPGWKYSAWATAPQESDGRMVDRGIGRVFENITVEAGQTLDIGDVQAISPEWRRPEADTPAAQKPAPSAVQESKSAGRQTIRGLVTGPDGKPTASAHVAVVAASLRQQRGGDLHRRDEVLAEASTDAEGRYELTLNGVSSKTHRYAALIARADGSALAWHRLNLDKPDAEVSLPLPVEKPIRGRLVDIEGRPAGGVRMSYRAVMLTMEDRRAQDGVGFREFNSPPAAWPRPVTTDADGHFVLPGIAAGQGVWLTVEANDRFAPQDISLNTGLPEQRGERDGTYRSQVVRNLKPGEEPVLALAPAQIFEGVVTYEDTGEPAPHARLTIWASQQKIGSMHSVPGKADAQGRYHIIPSPGIRFGITAYPPDGAPYLTRELPPIDWEDAATVKKTDVTLPRGILVRGEVIDANTQRPVPEATIQYVPEEANNPNNADDILTGWQGIQLSDDEGEFEIVVLPGPGTLLVHGPTGEFVLRESSSSQLSRGTPGGQRRYAHAFERFNSQAGNEAIDLNVELQPAKKVAGSIVDESGAPVDEALMITRLHITPHSPFWRGFPVELFRGRFELGGLASGQQYPTHFLDRKRRLGATVNLKADDAEPMVVLKPCGEATARFVDPDGQPLDDFSPMLEMIVASGVHQHDVDAMRRGELAADSDHVSNIDRTNHWSLPPTDDEGRITFPALIPGATYRIGRFNDGKWSVAKDFSVGSGESLDLGDIAMRLEN